LKGQEKEVLMNETKIAEDSPKLNMNLVNIFLSENV
jgi:hypothetical protein